MPDKPVSMTNMAYDMIKGNILTLKYMPGTSLSELKLSAELGMSRNPIRLAVRLLESEGLLIKDHYRQLTVKPVTRKDVSEIYQLRELLEGTAFRRIFDLKRHEEYAERLQRNVAQMQSAEGDSLGWEKADTEFHMEIVSIYGNERITKIYAGNQFELVRIGLLCNKSEGHVSEINSRLDTMLDCMKKADYEQAYEILYTDHLITGKKLALASLEA